MGSSKEEPAKDPPHTKELGFSSSSSNLEGWLVVKPLPSDVQMNQYHLLQGFLRLGELHQALGIFTSWGSVQSLQSSTSLGQSRASLCGELQPLAKNCQALAERCQLWRTPSAFLSPLTRTHVFTCIFSLSDGFHIETRRFGDAR